MEKEDGKSPEREKETSKFENVVDEKVLQWR